MEKDIKQEIERLDLRISGLYDFVSRINEGQKETQKIVDDKVRKYVKSSLHDLIWEMGSKYRDMLDEDRERWERGSRIRIDKYFQSRFGQWRKRLKEDSDG